MHTGKEQKSFLKNSKIIILAILAILVLFSACTTLKRSYVGHPVEVNPNEAIIKGKTNKGEVLSIFGPPTKVMRQYDGDLFVYEYVYDKGVKFVIEEPIITGVQLFTYVKDDEKRDLLVILFDKQGIVVNYGISRYASTDKEGNTLKR